MRAYLAGLGTAGCLVAGAALLFVMASAFVAFHGWPQIGSGPAPASVIVSAPATRASRTSAGRRLAALTLFPGLRVRRTVGPRASAQRRSGSAGGAPRAAGHPRPVLVRAPRPGSSRPAGGGGASTVSGGNGGAGGGTVPAGLGGSPSPTGPVAAAVSQSTQSAGAGVAGAGSGLGSTVSSVSNAVGGAVQGVSTGAGKVVQGAGQSAGGAVAAAGRAAGGAVSATGQVVSGALGGH